MFRKRFKAGKPRFDSGFTLVEVLVALAVMAMVLPAIGLVIATSVRASRALEERLVLAGIVEGLLAGLPSRALMRPGRSSGTIDGRDWQINVEPLRQPVPRGGSWIPFVVTIRAAATSGQAFRIDTVRLLPGSVP